MMTCPGVTTVLVLLLLFLLPEEDGVGAQGVIPGSPFPSDPYCDYYCILRGKEDSKVNHVDPYPISCLDLGPDDENTGTGCDTTPVHSCPTECTECDKKGKLWCPPLTQARRAQDPPPPKLKPFEISCLRYCLNLEGLGGGVTVDSGPYTMDCGGTWFPWIRQCGPAECRQCEGPLYQNPRCKPLPGRNGGFGLECPPLDRSLFPTACSNFCGEEAWLKGLTAKVTDKPFTVNCGEVRWSGKYGQKCGRDCPEECHGFCPQDGKLYCPAGVKPRERPTTTTRRPDAAKEEEGSDQALIIALAVVAVLVMLLVAVGVFFWCYKKKHGRRGVAPGPQQAYPTQQTYQPPPMMNPQQQQMGGAPMSLEGPGQRASVEQAGGS